MLMLVINALLKCKTETHGESNQSYRRLRKSKSKESQNKSEIPRESDLTAGGLCLQMQYGSIGWSVGALLGYQRALKDSKRVLAFIGDGSFQVTAQVRCF